MVGYIKGEVCKEAYDQKLINICEALHFPEL